MHNIPRNKPTNCVASKVKVLEIAILFAAFAFVIGMIAFVLNWFVWGGGMPGYKVLLWPGNVSLEYVWHPLFTEEIDFWPKLGLQLLSQFIVVFCLAWFGISVARVYLRQLKPPKQ